MELNKKVLLHIKQLNINIEIVLTLENNSKRLIVDWFYNEALSPRKEKIIEREISKFLNTMLKLADYTDDKEKNSKTLENFFTNPSD